MTHVPGTFKNQPPAPQRVRGETGRMIEQAHRARGAWRTEVWAIGKCTVIVAFEPYNQVGRWHISIAHPTRYPTWDEVKTAVYGIPTIELVEGRTFAQLLGPVKEGQWVDLHESCLHLYEIDDPLRTKLVDE
jgi:hypothetical protein